MSLLPAVQGFALAVVIASSHAAAQKLEYPQRPIRLIVGFTPGGSTDLVARLLGAKLSERIGQQVVIDNRPGASGIIAAELVSKSQPDGYTLLISGSSISIVGSLYKGITFDVQRDLEPLALVATSAYIMVAHPSIGVKTVQELIAYAKPRAGKISWGASTPGTVQHLSGEMFKRLAGIDMVFIPYKGTGAMMPDILGGRLQIAIDNILVLTQHIKLGALQALAVTTAKRTPILPDVPSIAESGFPGFDTSGWFSLYTTPKTPPQIVNKLNTEILAVVNTSEMRERLLTFGATPLPGTPDDLRRQLAREVPAWRKVIQDAGLKAE
ncbi:MAG TPA: tripartite tricarboxylate transporter substrate binding protein [Burkholderiales bacterium]|nr:tripartite tricarboxylate transporter substrate binding protein [Burkholderiales bacterium]